MSDSSSSSSSGGGCGCFSLILFVLLMWALIFGVTVENRHYNLGCSCDRGVSIDREAVER